MPLQMDVLTLEFGLAFLYAGVYGIIQTLLDDYNIPTNIRFIVFFSVLMLSLFFLNQRSITFY